MTAYEGMEDQVGALGLVLNAVVLFNTRYPDEDAARLAPFRHRHISLLGRYSVLLPTELAGGLRPLSDPDTVIDTDGEDDDLQ
ncbi:Tn3 family transposase [Amycolatopsis sp. FDAARGOS 1241]|nr:Tn3 family transposase [Amycolatopsis sp. FDAARGOS 1241]